MLFSPTLSWKRTISRDRAVLDGAQRDGVDLATMPLFARGQQVVRAQEAADVVMGGR